jgi:NAD+ kinase
MKKLKIKNVFLVYKRSLYQRFIVDEKNEKLKKLISKRHFSTRAMKDIHDTHTRSLKKIEKYLDKLGIRYVTEARHKKMDCTKFDLIITIGGDGTFLRTAHTAMNQLFLPVNSDPTQSVGALCSTDIHHFKEKLDEILSGRYEIRKLPLIQTRLNGKKLPIEAINDVLFTNVSPAATSRYYMKKGKTLEEHKSSGVWIATTTGSTAAISAAGGKKMHPDDKRVQFATREPYQGIFHPYQLTYGFLEAGEKLAIINRMMQAKIYIDGPTTQYDLVLGDEVEFSASKRTVKVLT